MAALVTLEQAKDQLNITADDKNALIQQKIENASAIILDYLKSRANKLAVIASSSVASPSVITTVSAHGYIAGEIATIAGHADSTPDINGSYVVTVLSTTTFSIPEAVTVAGTGGTAIVPWNDYTAPQHVQESTLLLLTHLFEHRGDDHKSFGDTWQAIERLLARSRDLAIA